MYPKLREIIDKIEDVTTTGAGGGFKSPISMKKKIRRGIVEPLFDDIDEDDPIVNRFTMSRATFNVYTNDSDTKLIIVPKGDLDIDFIMDDVKIYCDIIETKMGKKIRSVTVNKKKNTTII